MLKIYEDSINYTCQVIKLPNKVEVPGLNNLCKVSIFGNDCLIGVDSDPEELYLFFPAECKIDDDFLKSNNLYRHSELNNDKTKTGFFENNGRVRSVKFKGVVSTGFICPLSFLWNVTIKSGMAILGLNPGDEFNSIANINICSKYYKVQIQSTGKKESRYNKRLKRFDKLVPNQFRFHLDTSHLAKNLHLFKPDHLVLITDKWHGTSAIFGNVLINKELKWYEKIAKFIGLDINTTKYDKLYASRKVVKNQYINKEVNLGYYNEDIWGTVNKELEGKIEQGITLYGEIVGYLKSGKLIQKDYDYGCSEGDHKFLVYRITYTKPDGNVIEFSWSQIKDYCNRYSLETVKELYYGFFKSFKSTWFEDLQYSYLEKECSYCNNKVPNEGICIRIDGQESYMTYKLKSKAFILKETKELDSDEINIEDE